MPNTPSQPSPSASPFRPGLSSPLLSPARIVSPGPPQHPGGQATAASVPFKSRLRSANPASNTGRLFVVLPIPVLTRSCVLNLQPLPAQALPPPLLLLPPPPPSVPARIRPATRPRFPPLALPPNPKGLLLLSHLLVRARVVAASFRMTNTTLDPPLFG